MGNCFGKTSSSKNFQGEGRTVGASSSSAAPSKTNASIPSGNKISAPQSGRTLGNNPQAPSDSASPREAAAKAAEVRTHTHAYPSKPRSRTKQESKMVATAWL